MPKQFFPQSSRNELMVELRLPGGSSFSATEAEVAKLEFGLLVGFPVQFWVVGPDPAKVRVISYRVRDIVRQNPHARDVQLEWD